MNVINFIKKWWHAILFIAALLICLTLCLGGIGWTDYAKTPFWWNFWIWAAVLGGIGFIGLIFWFSSTNNKW
jgi:hypothetical protein